MSDGKHNKRIKDTHDKRGRVMAKFRKKPVEIEAVQFVYTCEGIRQLQEFCGDVLGKFAKGEVQIGTLEDGEHLTAKHIATEGDWVIKGVQGEFYPCKPDIFEQTYEPVVQDGE